MPTQSSSATDVAVSSPSSFAVVLTAPSKSTQSLYAVAAPLKSSLPAPGLQDSSSVGLSDKTSAVAEPSNLIPSGPIAPNNNNYNAGCTDDVDLVVKRSARRSVFVSRLAASTSEQDVLRYIRRKLKLPENHSEMFKCFKYKFATEREISSFRITPRLGNLDSLLNKNFWPAGTVIHEYVIKKYKKG